MEKKDSPTFPSLFIHIPKTAGTSFRKAYEEIVGQENTFYDYGANNPETSPEVKSLTYEKNDKFSLLSHISQKSNALLAGHFSIQKYAKLFPALQIITFVRNPINQVISHYEHFKRHTKYHKSLIEFCQEERFSNLQSKCLRNYPISAIGFIGLTEEYNASIELINQIHNINLEAIKMNFNDTKKTEEYEIDQTTKNLIIQRNQEDIMLYERAVNIFNAMKLAQQTGYRYTYANIHLQKKYVTGWCYQKDTEDPIILDILDHQEKIIHEVLCADFHEQAKLINAPRLGYVGFSIDCERLSGVKGTIRIQTTKQVVAEFNFTDDNQKRLKRAL